MPPLTEQLQNSGGRGSTRRKPPLGGGATSLRRLPRGMGARLLLLLLQAGLLPPSEVAPTALTRRGTIMDTGSMRLLVVINL